MSRPRPTSGVLRVLGLISGTSVDGVDAAVAELAAVGDELVLRPLGARTYPYPAELAASIRAAFPPAAVPMATVCALDTEIGRAFGAVAVRAGAELTDHRVDLVVSHGQTLFHWVDDGTVRGTLQLGQPAWIAAASGLPVLADLRVADVAAGGQGAPLVSLVDVWWLRSRPGRPVALNLGGIANLTTRVGTDTPIAYDVGPANALVNAVVQRATGGRQAFDADGARAAAGTVDEVALATLLADPYFALPAPKSTGKEHFHLGYLDDRLGPQWLVRTPTDDVVATVTALCAASVAAAVGAEAATEVVASGGGTANPTLLAMLGARLPGVVIRTSDELGLPSDAKEAYAFAVLGWLSWHGRPGTIPSCTGAAEPRILGAFSPGSQPLRLPDPLARSPVSLRIEPASDRAPLGWPDG